MKALIIKKQWLNLILSGKKIWEIRGSKTKTRDKIELIQSGNGLIIGCCEIIDCFELSFLDFQNNINKHQINDFNKLPYKKTYTWVINKAQKYETPRKYNHPKGAIIWVNIKN